ncbi:MAG: hypothetical protein IJ463_06160 [Bacilli bacterium]|nr:hypothetical protein [Bacilli bacterium]
MEEEILGVIGEEIDLVDDVELDSSLFERIEDKVSEQNDLIKMENYRLELLRILKEAKEMNIDISYDENMSVEELEEILASIKM